MPDVYLPNRITEIAISHFRGIRETLTLNLDASVVIATGPNGTGKTTIFDALLWAIRGDIPRLVEQRLRQTDEYIVNLYSAGEEATVAVCFRIDGTIWKATRTGDSRHSYFDLESSLGTFSGAEAERAFEELLTNSSLPLRDSLANTGLLQQDDLRRVLHDHPNERYMQVLRLLGLEKLEEFERFVQSELKEARLRTKFNENEMRRLRDQQAELGAEIETLRAISSATHADSELQAEPIDNNFIESAMAVSAAADETIRQIEEARTLLDRATVDVIHPTAPLPVPNLSELESRQKDAAQRLARGRGLSQAAQAAQRELDSLASTAITILEREKGADGRADCPVCSTHIAVDVIVRDLSSRAAAGAAAAQADLAVARLLEELATAEQALADAREIDAQDTARKAEQDRIVRAGVQFLVSLDSLRSIRVFPMDEISGLVAPVGQDLIFWLREKKDAILEALREVESKVALAASVALISGRQASAEREAQQRSSQLPRLLSSSETLTDSVRSQSEVLATSQRAERNLTELARSSAEATAEIFRKRFSSLEPLVNDIYSRLYPHPTFKRLDFRVESYRSRGTATATVTDEERNIDANPLLIFSSAQANIVVVAVFLAMGWAAPRSLPFIWLDDPLQSMDDVNVLGFSDLTRELRKRKQVVFSTHEDRYARLLERKLRQGDFAQDVIVHRFQNWSRTGPTVETTPNRGVEDLHTADAG